MIEQLGLIPTWQKKLDLTQLSLKKDELHLWWLPLTLNKQQKELTLSWLSQKQLDKYNRRTTPQLKEAYLAGRYYLLTLLGAYSKCKPNEVKLSYSRLNKPSLKTNTDRTANSVEFNFTDTSFNNKSFGLFAFCLNLEVGVDLEAINRKSNFELIAKRRFTPHELKFASDSSEQLNPYKCLSIWTRKEAYGKALGVGINFTMNQRNLVSDIGSVEYNFNDGQKEWRLLQIQPDEEFIACIVHESHKNLSIKAFNSL